MLAKALRWVAAMLLLLKPGLPPMYAQAVSSLDPTRGLAELSAPASAPLPEQYIWTAGDWTQNRPDHSKFPWNRPALRTEPHFFRASFRLGAAPGQATLYVAGPRQARVWVNGRMVGEFFLNTDQPINFRVFHCDVTSALKAGENTLAIEAVRGRGVIEATGGPATRQLAYGEVLVAKIVPAAFGQEAAPLVISDASWRSSSSAASGWQNPPFDDTQWPRAASLGAIESNVDFFQWSADAGMYGWPGYRGMSPALRTYALAPVALMHVFAGRGGFKNLDAITSAAPSGDLIDVTLPPGVTDAESPALMLDFGREVAGRLLVESASNADATLSIAYGESELEALSTGITPDQRGGNYLGTNLLEVPAQGTARGPKSGFRFVLIRFLRGPRTLTLRSIRLEGIAYPVAFTGSFFCSDPLLNRIWETSAWTVHLAMQDDVWDAPKRDRGRWAGDLDIEGKAILTAFGDRGLLEATLGRVGDSTAADAYVNGIPSYSALWVTTLESLYQRTADRDFVLSQRGNLLKILARMNADVGPDQRLAASLKGWNFVDWAPNLYGQTEDARMGTSLQFLRGFRAGAKLLDALADTADAERYRARADAMAAAAGRSGDSGKRNFGATWQINTLAVLTGLDEGANSSAWTDVLSRVKQDSPADQAISPYFSAYMMDAMSRLGHPEAALAWMRSYWGGMLAEGATSFWESYDLRWPKNNPHLSLEADGTSGFFVSLAHGWSAGPATWLAENVLGVTPASPGYGTVALEPHLLGLAFARGAVPTPHGAIVVAVDRQGITFDLPPGVEHARVKALTRRNPTLDGRSVTPVDGWILVDGPGHHVVASNQGDSD